MKHIYALLLLLLTTYIFAQDSLYRVSLDLQKVDNDRLLVSIETPNVQQDSIEFHLPKIVPGTYSISDFGRFLSGFSAMTQDGDTLSTERLDVNRWIIYEANRLSRIQYYMDDTFDKNDSYKNNYIFEPGGTSLEKDKGVFVLNTFGIIGYLDGYQFYPYELEVTHDPFHFGASSLNKNVLDATHDQFRAENYNFLADGPIMYCEPDTATKKIDGAEILISVYAPNDKISASEIMDTLDDLIEAQTNYLGGSLPVDRYAYLIYLMDFNPLSNGMGALEHSYSSLYTLPEAKINRIGQFVRDVAAHEFLHIVTPLNIHSEQIHHFNYIQPEMSRHLWMYEGVTEYSSLHLQVRNQLMDEEAFLNAILEKYEVASKFPAVSFTEMSTHILEEDYEPMYGNVYYKGALIGMCLDLLLIQHSDATMDLPKLMSLLAEKYGPHKPFMDKDLIAEITEMTFPAIGRFFERHVIGNQPLPMADVLKHAGYDFLSKKTVQKPTLGNISFTTNENAEIIVEDVSNMNAFGKEIGYREGDIITAINDQEVSLENIREILAEYEQTVKPGDKIKVVIMRDQGGKSKKLKLKAKAETVKVNQPLRIVPVDLPSTDQLKIRNAWLNGL
jgi:predicted metalloprotease with PDZ domain